MNWISWIPGLIAIISKLPIAQYIKPIWKGMLKSLIQVEGTKLEESILTAVASQGSGVIDSQVDNWQLKLIAKCEALPLPSWVKMPLESMIQNEGDTLQATLSKAFVSGQMGGLRLALDGAMIGLLAKIDAL